MSDGFPHTVSQIGSEGYTNTAPETRVPHSPFGYLDRKHFFKTHRLCTNLQVHRRAMRNAGLVFNRANDIPIQLDRIRPAGKTQYLRPQGYRAQNELATLAASLARVDSAVSTGPTHGVYVVGSDSVAVNQRALPRTVHKVFDSRYRDHNGFHQSRSAPKPLVTSLELLRWNLTVRQPP